MPPGEPEDPKVDRPSNPPPCNDFITAVPMAVSMGIWHKRKYLTLVKTTHGETLLKVQKTKVKHPSVRTSRNQYRVYSDKGKELIVSCDKNYKWNLSWPRDPIKEIKIDEKKVHCEAIFSNPFEEALKLQLPSTSSFTFSNKETGKVLVTIRRPSIFKYGFVLMMDKDVDVVLMTGLMMCLTEIQKRREKERTSRNGGFMVITGGGGIAACSGGGGC